MNALLVLVALWIGTMAGFLVFALMAMAREREPETTDMLARNLRRPAPARAAPLRF